MRILAGKTCVLVLWCQMERSCQFRRKWEGICNCNTSDIQLTAKPLSEGVLLD